jgi:hypothetical protein
MAAQTNPFDPNADRGNEVASAAVRTWTDTARSLAVKLGTGQTPLPDLQGSVEEYFEFAEKSLARQRALAQQWRR